MSKVAFIVVTLGTLVLATVIVLAIAIGGTYDGRCH